MFHGSPENGDRSSIDSRARAASSTRSNSTNPTTLPVRSLRIRHDSNPVKPRKWRSSADSDSSDGSSGRKSVCVGCVLAMVMVTRAYSLARLFPFLFDPPQRPSPRGACVRVMSSVRVHPRDQIFLRVSPVCQNLGGLSGRPVAAPDPGSRIGVNACHRVEVFCFACFLVTTRSPRAIQTCDLSPWRPRQSSPS